MFVAEEIYQRVARVLAESLCVGEDDVTPEATLRGDLGAESLDFLDIVFHLEHEFGIDIPDDELFPRSVFHGNSGFVQDGRLTDQGMHELRARMPYADLRGFEHDRHLSAIPDLFTVGLVARYIAWKLAQGSGVADNGHCSVMPKTAPAHQSAE